MPILRVSLWSGRTKEEKADLAKALTVKCPPLSRQKMGFFKVEYLFPPCCVFNVLYR